MIGQLAEDLKKSFPEMKGFSPRNLKYMRAFADAYPDLTFVQAAPAQNTWYHNSANPMGVSEYKVAQALPASLEASLPTIETIERELAEPFILDES